MVAGKLGLRMTTLHEETSNAANQPVTPTPTSSSSREDDEEKSDADYSADAEYDAYHVSNNDQLSNLIEKLSLIHFRSAIISNMVINPAFIRSSKQKSWNTSME